MVMSKETRKMMKGLPKYMRYVARDMDESELKEMFYAVKSSLSRCMKDTLMYLEHKSSLLPRNNIINRLIAWDYQTFIDYGWLLYNNGTPKNMDEWLDSSYVYLNRIKA